MPNNYLFYFLAGLAILSSAIMVTRRNPVHSAICLATTLLCTAGIFLQLHAKLLFFTQLILFTGAIAAFYMASNHYGLRVLQQSKSAKQKWIILLVILTLAVQILAIRWASHHNPGQGLLIRQNTPANTPALNSTAIVKDLLKGYALPLEVTVVLLIVSAIGVISMLKKRTDSR